MDKHTKQSTDELVFNADNTEGILAKINGDDLNAVSRVVTYLRRQGLTVTLNGGAARNAGQHYIDIDLLAQGPSEKKVDAYSGLTGLDARTEPFFTRNLDGPDFTVEDYPWKIIYMNTILRHCVVVKAGETLVEVGFESDAVDPIALSTRVPPFEEEFERHFPVGDDYIAFSSPMGPKTMTDPASLGRMMRELENEPPEDWGHYR